MFKTSEIMLLFYAPIITIFIVTVCLLADRGEASVYGNSYVSYAETGKDGVSGAVVGSKDS